MEQEYTISTGMKIVYGLLAVGMFGFALFLFALPRGSNVNEAVILLPLMLIVGSVLIIVNIIKKKIIIYDDRIICTNLFSTKELTISDIKGCRIGQKVIYIEPQSTNDKKITVGNYIDFGNSGELVKYLKEKFKDIDAIDLENERTKLLQNTIIGTTEADREEHIKKAKYMSWAYNILGFIGGFILLFLDNTKLSVIILLVYPLLGILLMISSKGTIKFLSNSKRSLIGFTMMGIVLPCFVLLVKSLFEWNLSSYDHLWLTGTIISVIVFGILYFVGINRSVESVKGQAIMMLITGMLYGFGGLIQVNCTFDNSEPKLLHAIVNDKWIEHNKGSHYHLKINSWDSNPNLKDIEVSSSTYGRYAPNSPIDINLRMGVLNIPWFTIAK